MTSRGRSGKKRKLQDYSHSRQTGTCFLCVTTSRERGNASQAVFLFTALLRSRFFFINACLEQFFLEGNYSSWISLFYCDTVTMYFRIFCQLSTLHQLQIYCYNIRRCSFYDCTIVLSLRSTMTSYILWLYMS